MANEKKSKERVPAIASFYLKLYYAIPRVYFPGTTLDVGFSLFWMALFSAARLAVYPFLVSRGWPENAIQTMDASACIVGSMMHASSVIPMTYILMRTQNPFHPSGRSKLSSQWWQDAVEATLQLCTGYMLYDSIFLLTNRYTPGEGLTVDEDLILYAGHHFFTSFYMTASRLWGAGQASALACIFFGELTNHPFNLFLAYDYAKSVGVPITGIWAHIQVPNEILVATAYIAVRVFVFPAFASYMSYNLLTSTEGRTHVPLALRIIWIFLMFVVLYGSIGHDIIFYNMLKQHFGFAEGAEQEL